MTSSQKVSPKIYLFTFYLFYVDAHKAEIMTLILQKKRSLTLWVGCLSIEIIISLLLVSDVSSLKLPNFLFYVCLESKLSQNFWLDWIFLSHKRRVKIPIKITK